MIMKGVYINSKEVPYASMIVDGIKFIETRTKRTLHKLIGEEVAVIETGKGKPRVVGYVTILCAHFCWKELWDKHYRDLAHIPKGSKFDNCDDGKWCYVLRRERKLDRPYQVPLNAIRHGRVWCEFEI